jgi:Nif-specific regulatory protein
MRKIEAVLCAPNCAPEPIGVLYLRGREGSRPFSSEDQRNAEVFARHLAPLAHRPLLPELVRPDPTRALRDKLHLEGIVGRSRALARLLEQVALVAPLDVNVLLTGESGTGKSHVARVIHKNGPRAAHPVVELNCAALPEGLVESELFGAMPGAHSTATRPVHGKVAAAERGTLFLDEVGELSLAAQAKLLQLIQSKQYYPLGATKPVAADVRVIAATNTDLRGAVAEHRFRADLFYRLQVLPIRVPSLAERREDVVDLATFFLSDACSRHRLPALELSESTLRAAQSAEWPGNVRQLAHSVEAAAIRAAGAGAGRIEPFHLFAEADHAGANASGEPVTFQEATRRFQASFLREALERADWNVNEVAQRLDVARSHVYGLIRAFGLR